MLSVFPTLFSYTLFVPLVFRIVVGLAFIVFGYGNLTYNRNATLASIAKLKLKGPLLWLLVIALLGIICGLTLIVGFYTQVTVLILSIMLTLGIWAKHKNSEALSFSQETLLLLLLVTISLLFLGPGFYAFDLPL